MKWAVDIAQTFGGSVTVLFCYRLISEHDEAQETLSMKRSLEAEALLRFTKLQKGLANELVTFRFLSEVGFFPSRIDVYLRKAPVDLLVIGNALVQEFNEDKILSFDSFISKSKIPVVIVPEAVKSLSINPNGRK
jgi:hypothetical protein